MFTLDGRDTITPIGLEDLAKIIAHKDTGIVTKKKGPPTRRKKKGGTGRGGGRAAAAAAGGGGRGKGRGGFTLVESKDIIRGAEATG